MRPPVSLRRRLLSAPAGFSLIELVVVVMIIGVIASIAAPKLLGTSQAATDNGLRQSLAIIRDAIDRFSADHAGALPGKDGQEATFKTDVAPYLRGEEFPTCPVGPAKNNLVHTMTGGGVAAQVSATQATHSWLYNYGTGDFYTDCDELSSNNSTTYDQF